MDEKPLEHLPYHPVLPALIARHVGWRNAFQLGRHTGLANPVKAVRVLLEERRRYYSDEVLAEGDPRSPGAHETYFLGATPGITIDGYLEEVQERVNDPARRVLLVMASCLQRCGTDRSSRSGDHHALTASDCELCRKCDYARYVDPILSFGQDHDHHAQIGVARLNRTRWFVEDHLVAPYCQGGSLPDVMIVHACYRAAAPNAIIGAGTLARLTDTRIIVGLAGGRICTQEEFFSTRQSQVLGLL
jgi:hypothetical protein